jgi:NADH dehydrogenase
VQDSPKKKISGNPYAGTDKKHVIVVGGGFGGLSAAKKLAGHPHIHVTLIDERNHHLFQPLLYQVATAGLNPADIAVPIRSIFSKTSNVNVHMSKVLAVNLGARELTVAEGHVIGYDYLILACGAQHSYFAHPEWEDFAPGLKTLEQAVEIRRRILSAFEIAENEDDPVAQAAHMTFVVVGGGPTGVELAGAIADISRTVLVKDFNRINPADAKIILIEAGPRVLASFPERLSEHALTDLEKLGVDVRVNARVEMIDALGVRIQGSSGDQPISARNVFWAAGVQASQIGKDLGVALDRAGRIVVERDLSIPGHSDAFVVGDLAHLELEKGKLLPGLAPAAIQSGEAAAANIIATFEHQKRRDFHYHDKGQMATIGKRRAIAVTGQLKLTGYAAWIAWLLVHILYLVGYKNRVTVLLEWAWSYIFSKRGSRLITSKNWKLERSSQDTSARRPA